MPADALISYRELHTDQKGHTMSTERATATRRSRRLRPLAIMAALLLVLSACTGDDDTTNAASTTTEPEATTAAPETTEAPATIVVESADEEPAEEEMFDPGPCAFQTPEDVDVECGWVTVPQNWDDDADPDTIRLHVATFSSEATPADATPVVYLEGGPGGDSLGLISFTFGDLFGPILDQHPLVIFTQRGSALSEIDLECEEVTDVELNAFSEAPDPDSTEGMEALQACAQRLQDEGADLTSYNSVASAHDADAVRAALGHDEWNVLGISYGTRLGQELARQHPEEIRALILDSVQPTDPQFGSLAAVPTTFERSLNELFAGCAADADCAAANPNLEERFRALVAQVDAEPIELVASDQLTGETYDVVVDDTRLLGSVFQSLYSAEAFSALPEMVEQLEAGDTSTLAVLVGLEITNAPFFSNGMYAAVMCHDYLNSLTPEGAFDAGLTGDPLFDGQFAGETLEELNQLCEIFPTGSADAAVAEPVQSDVPTLLMSGNFDPITPPSFAEAIEPGFSNSQVAVLPSVGHGAVGDECGMTIALDFFADPSSPADQSCIADIGAPNWIPASLEGTVFTAFEEPDLQIQGVHPEGWLDQGFGITVRHDANIAHQTVLIQQAANIPPEQFVGLLSSQFGAEPVELDSVEFNGREWQTWELDGDAGYFRFHTHMDDQLTYLVGFQASPGDIDDLVAHLLPTVLTEIGSI